MKHKKVWLSCLSLSLLARRQPPTPKHPSGNPCGISHSPNTDTVLCRGPAGRFLRVELQVANHGGVSS